MNEAYEQERTESEIERQAADGQEPNDDYPGSFFKVPGMPVPGRTEWSLL